MTFVIAAHTGEQQSWRGSHFNGKLWMENSIHFIKIIHLCQFSSCHNSYPCHSNEMSSEVARQAPPIMNTVLGDIDMINICSNASLQLQVQNLDKEWNYNCNQVHEATTILPGWYNLNIIGSGFWGKHGFASTTLYRGFIRDLCMSITRSRGRIRPSRIAPSTTTGEVWKFRRRCE